MYRAVLWALFATPLILMGARGCVELEIPNLEDTDMPGQDSDDFECEEGDPDCEPRKCDWDDDGNDDWDDDGNDDWDDDGDDDWDDDWSEPTCRDVGMEFFGPCGQKLGYGVAFGECEKIEGCKDGPYKFFKNKPECERACEGYEPPDPTSMELCKKTGGCWDASSCGHYQCGEFPACDAIIPGCDCGPMRSFVEGKGCVHDPDCQKEPSCDDLADVEFGMCEMLLGWAIIHGACEAVSGCGDMGYGFFSSEERCLKECAQDCFGNDDCSEGEYCDIPEENHCGVFGGGECQMMPDLCTFLYDPVCGCDGKTYGNSCMAAGAGISTVYDGACEAPSMCEEDDDCTLIDDYCHGCNCLAVEEGTPANECDEDDLVYCLVAPCMNKAAACIVGQCVVASNY